MNILITGGAGFIGSHLTMRLCKKHNVSVIDDLSNGDASLLKKVQVNFYNAEVGSKKGLQLLEKNRFDIVYHLAANAYIPSSVDNPINDFDRNLAQTVMLLEILCQKSPKTKVVLFSSAAVLGEKSGLMKEEDLPNPISPYGVSKTGIEFYGRTYAVNYGLKVQTLRLFPVYGPRQRKQVVFDLMKKAVSTAASLEIIGSGREERDLSFVDDAVDAIVAVAEKGSFDGGVINICSGKTVAIGKVAKEILVASGINKKIVYTNKLRQGDVKKMAGSVKLLSSLSNRKRTPFADGIKETWKWFKHEYC
ncbi:MAG: NAD-dependent epimerase/dehydratase family protein [Fibrobacteres bacterium]|nr:NAD-dependent epimerase/dehydratase family protein [Fibrobacterota bacterium]